MSKKYLQFFRNPFFSDVYKLFFLALKYSCGGAKWVICHMADRCFQDVSREGCYLVPVRDWERKRKFRFCSMKCSVDKGESMD